MKKYMVIALALLIAGSHADVLANAKQDQSTRKEKRQEKKKTAKKKAQEKKQEIKKMV